MKLGAKFAALAMGAVFWTAVPAHASLVVAVQFVPVNAFVGSTNNELDVTLQNTGPGASPVIAGFSFSISTTDADITFGDATINTTFFTYIFAGHSLFGPDIATTSPGQTMGGADVYDVTNSGVVVPANTTVALGAVPFNVSGTAVTGPVTITLAGDPTTSLSGISTGIPIDTFTNGQINIQATPEPATALLLVGALAGVFGLKRRRLTRG